MTSTYGALESKFLYTGIGQLKINVPNEQVVGHKTVKDNKGKQRTVPIMVTKPILHKVIPINVIQVATWDRKAKKILRRAISAKAYRKHIQDLVAFSLDVAPDQIDWQYIDYPRYHNFEDQEGNTLKEGILSKFYSAIGA